MIYLLGVFLAVFGAHAEISTVLESKADAPSHRSWFRPKFEWVQRSTLPVGAVEDEPDFTMENLFGLQFKLNKKQKIGLRVSTLHSIEKGENGERENRSELGDAHLRWVDSRYKGLFNDRLDVILTHKLYVPMRERSRERGELTHYKGWAAVAHNMGGRWTAIANFIPTLYAFRGATYRDGDGDAKSNVFYDVSASGQLMYGFNDRWFLSGEFGWGRREYLNRRREDIFPYALSMNYLGDNLEVSMGVGAEPPTTAIKFTRMDLFGPEYTRFFIESNLDVF